MGKKDDKKDKKRPAVVFTGTPGAGKYEMITQLAKHFEDEAKGKKKDSKSVNFLNDDGSFIDNAAFRKRIGAIKLPPLAKDQMELMVQTLVESGEFSLSPGMTMTKVAAELQRPENSELSIRKTLSTLTKKGLLKAKKEDKKPKRPKPR